MYSYTGKSVSNHHLWSSTGPWSIKNHVITNSVIKRLRCNLSGKHIHVPEFVIVVFCCQIILFCYKSLNMYTVVAFIHNIPLNINILVSVEFCPYTSCFKHLALPCR